MCRGKRQDLTVKALTVDIVDISSGDKGSRKREQGCERCSGNIGNKMGDY